ncbi:2797_t:CDS:10 [Paraglomus occultum]|uniref:2797_t:CDS:1 n=1 Tax=Paraglomus occultum TaxID=144539 RepID=A0A9N8WFB4_9GLOM|nr:2797_t:CDS:10 [Paraglomus occultum]
MDMPIAATAQPIGGDSNYYYPPQPITPSVETSQQISAKPPEKSRNLVTDLIETEKEYVENIKILLQKVTACWSPDNLPPQQLDTIFRCVEAIYKLNKRFSSKLSKIGTNPQAAQNLADLLMSWIDEMEGPYTRFCQSFMRGFDSWPAIIEHTLLQETLAAISSSRNERVSLDYYFELPFARLHYYKKLYMKLFKTTDPTSDVCQLLQIANDRLDALISLEYQAKAPEIPNFDDTLNDGSTYASEPPDHTQVLEHVNKYPRPAWNFGLTELEQQLDVTKVRDLFNKEPKKVKVALQPSSLPFQREIVMHDDFITIVRYADGDIMHRAHLFLLTDLLLICQTYSAEDRIRNPSMEFWLLYPPLSGRHLVIRDVKDSTDDIIEVTVMKREKIYFRAESKEIKDEWLKEFERVITFSATVDVRPQVKTNTPSSLHKSPSTPQLRTPTSPSDVVNSGSSASPVMGLPRSPANGSPASPVMGLPRSPVSGSPASPVMGLPTSPVSGSPVSPMMGLPRSPPNGSPGSPEKELPMNSMRRLSASANKGLPSRPSAGLQMNLANGVPRSRTPEPPRSAGDYPGGLNPYPSEQGRYSDSDLSRNAHFGADAALSANNPLKRSNSLNSLASVSTIASVKETLYQTPPCEVSIWKNGDWVLLTRKERCLVEVRLSTQNKGCWAIILERSGRMVLNAWVHPTTSIRRESPTDISLSCELASRQEYYRVNCLSQTEADKFQQSLQKIKYLKPDLPTPLPSVMAPQIFVSRSSSLASANGQPPKEAEAVVTQVMEARCRLFLQNDHGVWTSLGWGNMKLLLEISSHRKRIIINSDKNKSKLIDSIVWEDGVEKVGKAGVAITLKRLDSNVRIVYMMQMKDEKTAVKTIEMIKEKKLK